MNFDSRSYGGKYFRPSPDIHLDEGLPLLIISTPWGASNGSQKVFDRMLEYLQLAQKDEEITSPFPRQTCLGSVANNLRIATLLANAALYKEENQTEYSSGAELFACYKEDNEFTWIQVGQPNIVLCREGETPMPLGSFPDLVLDFERQETRLSPLPSNLIGIENSLNLNISSFRPNKGDKILLISRSRVPGTLFSLENKDINLDLVSRTLAKDREDQPFWLGLIEI